MKINKFNSKKNIVIKQILSCLTVQNISDPKVYQKINNLQIILRT